MARNDVAIYAPYAGPLYEREGGSSGGAELQAMLLARALSSSGLRTAHIVFPVRNPDADGVALVERRPSRATRRLVGKLSEARDVWSAMSEANARTYVVRTGGVHLSLAALFCRL